MVRRGALIMVVALTTLLTGCNRAGTQDPAVTLSQAAEALNQVSGFHEHVVGPPAQPGQTTYAFDFAVRSPGAAAGTITLIRDTASATYPLLIDSGTLFGQGEKFAELYSGQFSNAPADVDRVIANGWFKDSAPATTGFFTAITTPVALGACLSGTHAQLGIGRSTTVSGNQGVVITDKGNGQDIPSMRYSVASSGTPYPLTMAQTGDVAPLTAATRCPLTAGVTITFSDFGSPVSVSPPGHAVDAATLR